ncbi:clathrin light chain-domain-containing protein [Entophlyctis helioformis]|nr:clathrin light chain-domain-containing protein [Entophlyctis helioformis]
MADSANNDFFLGDDPAADFLAREQAILGADAALFGNPITDAPAASASAAAGAGSDFAAFSSAPVGTDASANVFGAFDAGAAAFPPPASVVLDSATANTTADIFAAAQQPLPAGADLSPANDASSFGFNAAAFPEVSAFGVPSGGVFAPVAVAVPEIEPEPLREWRERFNAAVAERDARSKGKHDLILQQAKENLERFYAEYSDKKTKSIAKNKELEKTLLAARDDTASGTVWERAVKQIESAQASNKDKKLDDKKDKKDKAAGAAGGAAAGPKAKTRDTARFKQLLFSLRNDKSAPGVAV